MGLLQDAGQRSLGEYVEGDLEILPLMNLFVVLIPMLLISAVFVHMSVIRMNLPSDEAAEAAAERERLGLSVEIQEEVWVVKGRRLEARTIDRLGEQRFGVFMLAWTVSASRRTRICGQCLRP